MPPGLSDYVHDFISNQTVLVVTALALISVLVVGILAIRLRRTPQAKFEARYGWGAVVAGLLEMVVLVGALVICVYLQHLAWAPAFILIGLSLVINQKARYGLRRSTFDCYVNPHRGVATWNRY